MNDHLTTSPEGIALMHYFEDCRLKAYPDPKSGGEPWTCGWGETEGVKEGMVWTQPYADQRFVLSLAQREKMVYKYVTHDCTQGQFDAFVSILYNVGEGRSTKDGKEGKDGIVRLRNGKPSTLLRKFNAGDIGGCETEWLKWISPGSNVEKGLYRRRRAELTHFRGGFWRDAL